MEDSWMYNCAAGLIGDARPISDDDWHISRRLTQTLDRTEQGVIYTQELPYAAVLAPTNPGGNIVRIAPGAAIVTGVEYRNDDFVDIDVTGTGLGVQTDLIVLRFTAAANTVRLAHIQGTPGGAAATVTQTAAIWEIAIAELAIDAGGALTGITDVRKLANTPLGTHVKINEIVSPPGGVASIVFTNIFPLFTHLKIVASCVYNLGAGGFAGVRFNTDAGANYDYVTTLDNSLANISTSVAAANQINIIAPNVTLATVSAYQSFLEIDVSNYKSTVYEKSMAARTMSDVTPPAVGPSMYATRGTWANTAAITDIEIFVSGAGSFLVDSLFTLYGIM